METLNYRRRILVKESKSKTREKTQNRAEALNVRKIPLQHILLCSFIGFVFTRFMFFGEPQSLINFRSLDLCFAKNSTQTKQKVCLYFKRLGYFVSKSRLTVLYTDSLCFVFVGDSDLDFDTISKISNPRDTTLLITIKCYFILKV